VSLSQGGKVTSVDPSTPHLGDRLRPPQGRGRQRDPAAEGRRHRSPCGRRRPHRAGARSNRLPSQSTLQPGIHVLGDAAIMGGMPKSAFAANAQAKVCAAAIVELLAGRKAGRSDRDQHLLQLVAPDYGISIAGVYRARQGGAG